MPLTIAERAQKQALRGLYCDLYHYYAEKWWSGKANQQEIMFFYDVLAVLDYLDDELLG